MDSRYKVILSNNNLYKEVEFSSDMQMVKVGTSVECDFRLRKNLFFGQIELAFSKTQNGWVVVCSDNLYITAGDVRKFATKQLVHGDVLEVRYQDSDNIALTLEFLLDFDNGKRKYERIIDVSGCNGFSIGADNSCNIVLKSNYVKRDFISFTKTATGLEARVQNTTYGVYHNGRKTSSIAQIGNGDFFSVSDYFFYYKNGRLWTEIRDDIVVSGMNFFDKPVVNNYPLFNRNTRIRTVIDDEKIEILDPPAKPQKPKGGIVSRLLPSIIMVVAGLAMSTVSPFMLISSGIGVVTAIIGIIQNKKDFKSDAADRITKYNAYIDNKKREIEECRNEEHKALEEIYISPEVEQNNFSAFSSELFDRDSEDEDFLCVRLGTGDVEAKREINFKKQEKLEVEDDLQQIPENIFNQYKNIHNAPIVCNFKESNAVGIVGEDSYRFEMLKNIVIDIIARHYHSDVKMLFVAEQQHKANIRWMRLLPHVYNDALGIRNIVCDAESKNIIFEYLYKELTFRQQQKTFEYRIVAFFFDEYGFKSHPISKFVDNAQELGVTFVFFGNSKADIPMGCDSVIEIKDGKNAVLINSHDKSDSSEFTYPHITNEQAANIVDMLAPVYTEEISLEGTLTKNISMFELLNIIAVDDIDLAARWGKSQVFKSMSAPLGVSKSGVVSLDLHDKAHGPHGLVAGTTGSGKSEILQTYILAMATLFHPYEVAFVIIDFKGGGMVNQFKELPHLIGAITNIDGKEIERSLKSIKAELQKRQRLFADADVNHIDKYIKKFKAGEVSTPLPHLIIIVDEFAELKAEQPEFMKELISAARIGRSLGVHLILATQKPSGQVNEQIWSNSRFKLCLKVQDQQDSNEVIKSPLAAEIKEPGRAYLQVGNNEIFELFQSAYSGASEKADSSNVKEFTIYGLTDSGRRVPVYSQKKQKSGEGSATQLEAIVKYVSNYCETINLPKLPDICLPPLREVINFPEKDKLVKSQNSIIAEIGIYDDPDNQYQGGYNIDLATGNLMIIGSSQSGKTNMLQSIIRGLATKYTPDEVNIYIIDFASMVLKNFDKLNHVGGVVISNEDEKLKNLFKLLLEEIEERKKKLLSAGVSNFVSYKEAGNTDLSQIILIVDNITALNELYLQDDDVLLSICRDGITVGISVIVANSQTQGIGYKYMSNFSSRITLFCNDSSEYSSVFDYCKMKIPSIPGRCIIELEKQHYECQSYLAFVGEKEFERVEKMKQFVEKVNAFHISGKAKRIPQIPDLLFEKDFEQDFGVPCDSNGFYIGLNYATVNPVFIDYMEGNLFAISGKNTAGINKFLSYFKRNIVKNAETIFVMDDYTEKFNDISMLPSVELYSQNLEDFREVLLTLRDSLKERYEKRASNGAKYISALKPIVCIINNSEACKYISANREVLALYNEITNELKGLKAFIVFADIENATINYNSPEVIKKLKDNASFLIFDDVANIKLFDLSMAVTKKYKKHLMQNDALLIKNNELTKVKIIN